MRKFKVTSSYDNWETIDSECVINEKELKELAVYYYQNSDEVQKIDFSILENAIEFIKRVDRVEEI
ncbi:hypothetical protein [Neobacillus sp. DY30]|uniref:hypothetical protein n=1 Tax=Neobacillus sp. DY30 TaxID=3047871 RepID=UPI0024C0906A|nr:hypothetical protein [Neobacillus sp. DY30]WHY01854.1 hypothetical protein QNH29_06395 [Neobacillus sp. DY30]